MLSSIFGALGRKFWDLMEGDHSVIAIVDRVATIFKAVVVAVMPTKSSDRGLNKARRALMTTLERNRLEVPEESLAMVLRHGDNLEESLQTTLNREGDPGDERHRLYRLLLQSELER